MLAGQNWEILLLPRQISVNEVCRGPASDGVRKQQIIGAVSETIFPLALWLGAATAASGPRYPHRDVPHPLSLHRLTKSIGAKRLPAGPAPCAECFY